MKVTLVKLRDQTTGNTSLHAHDGAGKNAIAKLSEGELVILDLKKSRNPKFHRYAFVMFRTLLDMVDEQMALEPWVKLMTTKIGRFTSVGKVDINGTTSVAVIPDSISFEAMDEIEFHKFTTEFHNYFCERYGNKVSYKQLKEIVGWV
jgi:hypothetical protein